MGADTSGPSILLVEDEAIIALSEARILENAGFTVRTVHSGEAAVEVAGADHGISLVLMDIDLGAGMDGTEAATRILAARQLPIVFLTSHAEKEMVDRVKGITRYGYVLKNSGEFVLVESVNMALELFRAHEETRARERRIAQLNRTYQVLSDVNQTIVRAEDTADLFTRICDIAIDRGDFRLAWVGRPDEAGGRIAVAATDRNHRGMIDAPRLEAGGSASTDLTVRAYRSGRTEVADELAPEIGGGSAVALPVRVFGEVRLLFTLQAPTAGFFDEAERALLDELVMDLGFAVEARENEGRRREAEHERREWQQLLSYIIEHDPNAITVLDTELRHVFVSDRFCEVYGVTKEETIGRHHYEVFPEIPEKWRRVHQRGLQGVVSRSDDDYFLRLDGSVDYTRWECRPWYRGSGEIGGIVLYTEVITSMKTAEERRRTVLGALEALLSNSPDLVSMIDAGGRYWMVSDSVAEVIGLPKDAIIGSRFDELLPPEAAEEYRRSIERVVTSGTGFSKTDVVPRPDGELTYRTTLFPARATDGRVDLVGVISADVTESVRMQARLAESERRWQYALEGAGDGLWDWDATTDRVFFSRQWKEMLGYADEEIGDTLDEWESRIHPDDYEETMRVLELHLRGETEEYRHQHRLRCKDGSYRWILDRGRVIERNEDGTPRRVIGTHTDIDERLRLELELSRSEEKYRRVTEATTFGFWIVTAEGRLLETNRAYAEMSGYATDELVGMSITELDPGVSQADIRERAHAIRTSGATIFEAEHRRKDGSTFPVVVHANLLDPQSQEFFAIIEDVTRRSGSHADLERELQRREIMLRESHHRVKNDLQSVGALLNIQAEELADAAASSALSEAAGRIEVMSALYEEMYRSGEQATGRLDLLGILRTVAEHVEARFGRRGAEITCGGDSVEVERGVVMPMTVIANELLTNAIKHGPSAGADPLRVELRLTRNADESVSVTVDDNGPGIPTDVQEGRSSGFGLSIARQLGAQIGVELALSNDSPLGGARVHLRMRDSAPPRG